MFLIESSSADLLRELNCQLSYWLTATKSSKHICEKYYQDHFIYMRSLTLALSNYLNYTI